MGDRKHKALLIGFRDVDVLRLVSAVGSMDVDFHRALWVDGLGDHLTNTGYDAILLTYPTEANIHQFLEVIRHEGGPNRRAGVVALADANLLVEAHHHLGCGINRVVPLTGSGDTLHESLLSLLHVARRYSLRIPLELSAVVDTGEITAFCNTENVSSSGMLVSCSTSLSVGIPFEFSMTPPTGDGEICGTAQVARITDPDREHVLGVGATFLSFPTDHRSRFEGILSTYEG